MKDNQTNLAGHPPEKLIAAYAIGKCSPIEQAEIDEHCFTCERCRTRLSILLRLCALDGNDEERRQLERLFPLGMETIIQVRHPESTFNGQSIEKDRQSLAHKGVGRHFPGANVFRSLFKTGAVRQFRYAIASIVVLAVAGAAYYWYETSHSPLRNSLLAMQRSYQTSRPIEARVTGEFAYKPYSRTRGDSENSGVNKDQLNYALLELTRLVATTTPTAQERHALGRLYLFLGKFDEAEQNMRLALEGLGQDARLLTDIAALYYERSKYSDGNTEQQLHRAIEYYKQAISLDQQLAEAWFNRALCYETLALYSDAKEDWKQYLKIDPDSEWAQEARERLKKLETRASQPSSPANQLNGLEDAIASKDDEKLRQLISQNFVQIKEFSIGQLFDDYLSTELKGDRQSAENYLKTLKRIGALTTEVKNDKFIADLATLAARASPRTKSGMLDVRLKLRQADNEVDRSSHDTAYKLYLQAYKAAERIGDTLHAEIAASNLIRYSHSRSDTGHLIDLGNRLVSQAEQSHHQHILALTHTSLANAFLASQQGSLALKSGLKAAEIGQLLGDINIATNGLIFAGAAYTRSGNYERAYKKSFEVLTLLRDNPVSLRRSFQAYQQAWESLFRLGNYDLALNYQQEAMTIANRLNSQAVIAGSTGRIGLNLSKLGKNEEAITNLKDAISKSLLIKDKTSRQLLQTDLYTVLGDIQLALGAFGESLASYQNAMESIVGSSNSVYLSTIHQGKAAAYQAQNRLSEAETELQTSISLIENDRNKITNAEGRNIFMARSQNAYDAMVGLQYNFRHNAVSAFNYAEIVKSRDLLDSLTNQASPKEIDGRIEVALSGNTRPSKLQQIQRSLPNNIQILSYSVTEKNLIIWHVAKDSFSSTSVDISETSLKKLIQDFALSIRAKSELNNVNRLASELYGYLISPLTNRLDNNRILCIIPDASFNQLPFAALMSPDKKRYLVEDFSIVTSPSASVLLQTIDMAKEKAATPTKTFIGISNPRFSNRRFPGLSPLPSSEEEVAKASQFYKHGVSFSQENATESQTVLKFGQNDVIHIASHTLINEQIPLMSAILMAEEKSRTPNYKNKSGLTFDSTLQASEIYRLKLPQTKLVILSSCRSALGNHNQSQAVGALAQAFFAAKVPSVIASLWDIDDARSSELMLAFHQYHKNQSLGFSDSLRLAQCSFLYGNDLDRRHPYYWAAFQLFGYDSANLVNNH